MKFNKKLFFSIGIVFVMSTFFGLIESASATGLNEATFDANGNTIFSPGGSNIGHLYYPDDLNFSTGLRVAIVDQNGVQYGSTVDYINTKDYNNLKILNLKVSTTVERATKTAYINGDSSLYWNDYTAGKISTIARPMSELDSIFSTYKFENEFNDLFVKDGNLSDVLNGLSITAGETENIEDYRLRLTNVIDSFLNDAGLPLLNTPEGNTLFVKEDPVSGDKYYDLFIVFEVTTILIDVGPDKLPNNLVLGTGYEIANYALDRDAKLCSGDATCDIQTPLLDVGNMGYLDGDLLTNSLAGKFPSLVNTFKGVNPEGNISYFNGALEVYPSNAGYDYNENERRLAGGGGVGLIVLWPTHYLDPNPIAEFDCKTTTDYIDHQSGIDGHWETTGREGGMTIEELQGYLTSFNNTVTENGFSLVPWYAGQNNKPLDGSEGKDFIEECLPNYGKSDLEIALSCEVVIEHLDTTRQYDTSEVTKEELIEEYGSIAEYYLYRWFVEDNQSPLTRTLISYFWDLEDKYGDDAYREAKNIFLRRYPDRLSDDSAITAVAFRNLCFPESERILSCDDTIEYIENEERFDPFDYLTGEVSESELYDALESYNNRFKSFENFVPWDIGDQAIGTRNFIDECLHGIPTHDGDYNCSPQFGLGVCIDPSETHYNDVSSENRFDENYWENCIFNDNGTYDVDTHKSSNDTNTDLTYRDRFVDVGAETNPYCEVYCTEEVYTYFEEFKMESVEAGRYFVLPYNSVKGSRTCKTKTYDYDKFEEDLEAANEAVVEAYQELIYYTELNAVDWEKNSTKNCDYGCTKYSEAPAEDGSYPCISWGDRDYRYYPNDEDSVDITISTPINDFGYDFSDREDTLNSVCGKDSVPSYTDDVKTATEEYDDAVAALELILSQMESCSDWDTEDVYEVDPKLELNFKAGSYTTNGFMDLDANTDYDEVENNFDKCEIKDVDSVGSCEVNSDDELECGTDTDEYLDCSDVEITVTVEAETEFELPSNFYRYVAKNNNTSYHNASDIVGSYIDLGWSTLPIPYSADVGTNSNFDFEYSNLGHIENGKTQVDTILLQNNSISEFIYDCEFNVYKDLFDDGDESTGNGGIRIIYRPIDLDNPFPDITSLGRVPGYNWSEYETRNDSYVYVDDYILNNRTVKSEELYMLDPMYTFTLTPSAINDIRSYNDNNQYGAYVGGLGSSNDSSACVNGECGYTCHEGDGIACISDYLTYLIDNYGGNQDGDNKGVCSLDSVRNASDPDSFYLCRFDDVNTATPEY